MRILRTSPVSGKTRILDIDISQEQLTAWEQGELIQRAAPHLSEDDREFIITGITSDEWDSIFSE
jgi:hypothetical protein